jgi:hypothetical protein
MTTTTPVEGLAKKTLEGQVMKTSVGGRVKKADPSGKTPHDINPVTVHLHQKSDESPRDSRPRRTE